MLQLVTSCSFLSFLLLELWPYSPHNALECYHYYWIHQWSYLLPKHNYDSILVPGGTLTNEIITLVSFPSLNLGFETCLHADITALVKSCGNWVSHSICLFCAPPYSIPFKHLPLFWYCAMWSLHWADCIQKSDPSLGITHAWFGIWPIW